MSETIQCLSIHSCGNFSIRAMSCSALYRPDRCKEFPHHLSNYQLLALNFRNNGKKIHILGRNEFDNFSFSGCI